MLGIVWTWPLAPHMATRIPHDPGDPVLNIWLIWWNAQALPFTGRWWSPPIFHPMPGALGLSEHLAGLGILTTPLQMAGASALTAYNVALILSFALSGYLASLLVYRLTGSRLAGVCAGLAFGFSPYRAGQLAHIQVLTSHWMPLALLALHAYADGGRRIWLAVFAASWLLQALSNGYYLLFFPVLLALWIAWFGRSRRGLAIAAAWIVSSLLLVPVLLEYARIQRSLGLTRTTGEMWLFSATPRSFFQPSGMLAVWPFTPARTEELYLFTGVTALAVAAIGCVVSLRAKEHRASPLIFYAGAAVLMYGFALGPAGPDSGAWALAHPYTLLAWLPGFAGLRVPARFVMLGTLCLSVAAGLAIARLAPSRPRARFAIGAIVIAGLAVDGWMRPMPLVTPPGRLILPELTAPAVVELPLNEGIVNTAAMFRAMQHGRPLVNGYSGHTPPHYTVLSTAINRGDPSVVAELARGRPLVVVVNDRLDVDGSLRRLIETLPGVGFRGGTGAGSLFVVPPQPARRSPPPGPRLPAAIVSVDRNRVEIDLGGEHVVRTVEFALRWHAAELDPRIAVEASVDRVTWSTVWEDWTGAEALVGALEDPLVAPVRIFVPDVRARYLRVHPAPRWLQEGLAVYGAR